MINRKKLKSTRQSILVYPNTESAANQEPELTPSARKAIRKELDVETPAADQHKTSPAQPLYEDKTEVYFRTKQKKSNTSKL